MPLCTPGVLNIYRKVVFGPLKPQHHHTVNIHYGNHNANAVLLWTNPVSSHFQGWIAVCSKALYLEHSWWAARRPCKLARALGVAFCIDNCTVVFPKPLSPEFLNDHWLHTSISLFFVGSNRMKGLQVLEIHIYSTSSVSSSITVTTLWIIWRFRTKFRRLHRCISATTPEFHNLQRLFHMHAA